MSTELEWTLTQISRNKHTCSPTERLKTFSSYIIRLPQSCFFRSFWDYSHLFPEGSERCYWLLWLTSLRKESFSFSALCFSYSSARDSRETALGSANWFVNVTVVRHIRFECLTQLWLWTFDVCIHWGLDSLILWDVMGELQLNQGLSCWFNSCMIILENMTQTWAVQLNIQRLLWNQTILQSLMLESLRILSYCTELSLLLLFIIKISLHTLTWETKIRNFLSMSKISQILFSLLLLLLVVVVVVSYYGGVKINRCIDASRRERE